MVTTSFSRGKGIMMFSVNYIIDNIHHGWTWSVYAIHRTYVRNKLDCRNDFILDLKIYKIKRFSRIPNQKISMEAASAGKKVVGGV